MALKALRGQPTRFVTIISADHFSEAPARFQKFFCLVKKEALRYPDQLFLAGSLPESFPTKSHSKFGWISVKKAIGARSNSVKSFAEKPSGVRLNRIRKNGGLINSGMFFGQLEKMQAFFFGVKDLAVVKVGGQIMIVKLSKAESRVLDRSRGRGSNYLERS